MNIFVKDFHWPTLPVCNDLQMPMDFVQVLMSPETTRDQNTRDEKDKTIQELKAMIKEL